MKELFADAKPQLKTEPLRIYVAHRYSCSKYPEPVIEILASIGRAVEAGATITEKGHYPFIPHLDCLLAMKVKNLPVKWYLENSTVWLKQCNAILILDPIDLVNSQGVLAEFKLAQELGFTIFRSLDEVPQL
jgi:hypothetical protein